ncbi:MAG: hypothetical protein SFU98_14535 [Leptospiraceae bacterium]|nr:hypothetical protein [Leptospiraceae bacterium]
MAKWKLLLSCIPYVLVVAGLDYFVSEVIGFSGIVEFADVALVLTGGIFLIGFMLAGTMQDYKESEKIPGELASFFESLEETILQAAASAKTPIDKKLYIQELHHTVETVLHWLHKRKSQEEMFASLHALTKKIIEFEAAGANGGACGKIIGDVHSIRKIVTRIGVISRTGFLATGYALLEVLIFCIVCLLIISKFKTVQAEYILISFVTTIYVYMYRLIKDVDDPFEYSPDEDFDEANATEIPLFPIREYLIRSKARHGQ